MFEAYFRYRIHTVYLNGDFPAIIYTEAEARETPEFWDNPDWVRQELRKSNPHIGHFKQDRDITLWFYNGQHKLRQEVNFHTNNLGFLSKKNYAVPKLKNEYRIAFLGDSMTGSTTTNAPWVDRVEDILNADQEFLKLVGRKMVRTINLGQPGASFPHFSVNYHQQGKLFLPDLIVVNYIESDFPRQLAPKPKPGTRVVGGWLEYRGGPDHEDIAKLNVTCEEPPVSLSNPGCRQNYFFVMPRKLAGDPQKVKRIKMDVAHDFLRGQLWTSPYPFALLRAFGHKVDLRAFRHPEVFHIQEPSEEQMIDQAAKSLREIIEDAPNALITVNPTHGELVAAVSSGNPYRKTDLLQAKISQKHIVKMQKFMPVQHGEKEIYRWFNLPHDGHFSDYGAELYAEAMTTAIKRHLTDR